MKKLHCKIFSDIAWDKLTAFVNENNIPKEDIVSITHSGGFYSLFFYAA